MWNVRRGSSSGSSPIERLARRIDTWREAPQGSDAAGKKPYAPAPARPASGFEEAALSDLDARLPPEGAVTRPAYTPRYKPTARLSPDAAAGGGLVRGHDGSARPHYWGHRDRLRTRFLTGGHDPMPEYEILELLLFNAIPRIDVKPLAKRLLAAHGDLAGVFGATDAAILGVEGATDRVVYQLRLASALAQRLSRARIKDRPVMSSWDEVVTYCRSRMALLRTESFRVLFLDRKNTLIADEEMGRGTVSHVPVYPREVARKALELNASAVILLHNHPSGDPSPSEADIEMTLRVVQACRAVDVTVHDHMIIGAEGEYSFRGSGLMDLDI